MLRLSDDRVIAPDVSTRREIARLIYRSLGGAGLMAFNCADTHMHLEVAGSRQAIGERIRRLEIALSLRLSLPVPFSPARFKPIVDQRHLDAAFRYILDQSRHHELDGDPFFDGSSILELLGLRTIDSRPLATVRALLPRVKRAELLELAGSPQLDQSHPPLDALASATAAAAGLARITGSQPAEVNARCAAIAVAQQEATNATIASLLGVSPRTIQRNRSRLLDSALVAAIRRQLSWRASHRVSIEPAPFILTHPRPRQKSDR